MNQFFTVHYWTRFLESCNWFFSLLVTFNGLIDLNREHRSHSVDLLWSRRRHTSQDYERKGRDGYPVCVCVCCSIQRGDGVTPLSTRICAISAFPWDNLRTPIKMAYSIFVPRPQLTTDECIKGHYFTTEKCTGRWREKSFCTVSQLRPCVTWTGISHWESSVVCA